MNEVVSDSYTGKDRRTRLHEMSGWVLVIVAALTLFVGVAGAWTAAYAQTQTLRTDVETLKRNEIELRREIREDLKDIRADQKEIRADLRAVAERLRPAGESKP